MTRSFRVGVVGGGVGLNHIQGYRDLPGLYEVAAFCDIDADRAGKVANDFAVPRIVTSFEDMLALDLDIVDICTPSSLHFEQASKALSAGFHVVVEKPLAGSLAEADALAELERKSGKRVSPIFQYRFSNGIAQLLHLRRSGLAGRAYVTTIETHWRRTRDYYDNPWRGRWATELGGTLITHAIHSHDLMTYVLGPVSSVIARTATLVNRIETEDCAVLLLELADGSFATSSTTTGAEEDMSRLRFCFEGLTAESNLSPYNPGTTPWRFIAADPERQKRIDAAIAEVARGPERSAGQFLRLHAALSGDGELPVSIADARASIELLTAAYHSARTGAAVRLPIGPDHPLYSGWLPPRVTEVA